MSDNRIDAHELFTPLHAIDGAVELLLGGSSQRPSTEMCELLGLIAGASRELSEKVDILLAIASLSGKPAGYMAVCDLADISACFELSALPEASTGKTVEVDIEALRKMVEALQNYCGLKVREPSLAWHQQSEVFEASLGRIASDGSTGEGALGFRLAQSFATYAGVRLSVVDDQKLLMQIPVFEST